MDSASLWEGPRLRLDRFVPEADAPLAARWSEDLEWCQQLQAHDPPRPLSPAQVRSEWQEQEKGRDTFLFAIRLKEEDRLIGLAAIQEVSWMHRSASLLVGIAEPADRRRGYGSEALALLTRYAFDELNLHRLSAVTHENNPTAVRLFERAGFVPEVRMRKALQRGGHRWDAIVLGLLREEWERARSDPGEMEP
jgi:RimJ/RimL family protein N-acetyltransferase